MILNFGENESESFLTERYNRMNQKVTAHCPITKQKLATPKNYIKYENNIPTIKEHFKSRMAENCCNFNKTKR